MDSFHEYNNSYKFGLSTIHPQSSHSTKVSFGDQFFSKPSIGLEIPHHWGYLALYSRRIKLSCPWKIDWFVYPRSLEVSFVVQYSFCTKCYQMCLLRGGRDIPVVKGIPLFWKKKKKKDIPLSLICCVGDFLLDACMLCSPGVWPASVGSLLMKSTMQGLLLNQNRSISSHHPCTKNCKIQRTSFHQR